MLQVISRKPKVQGSVNYKPTFISSLPVSSAQHAQLYDSFKHHTDDLSRHTQEAFDAFRDSIARHLEQLFGSVPVQIEGLT